MGQAAESWGPAGLPVAGYRGCSWDQAALQAVSSGGTVSAWGFGGFWEGRPCPAVSLVAPLASTCAQTGCGSPALSLLPSPPPARMQCERLPAGSGQIQLPNSN